MQDEYVRACCDVLIVRKEGTKAYNKTYEIQWKDIFRLGWFFSPRHVRIFRGYVYFIHV